MNAQIRKEVRALFPYWAGTLAITMAPYLLLGRGDAELAWLWYCFGCALLGGLSFGHEFQHGTLSLLLAQPLSRAVIWREKMIVLATALATSTAVLIGISNAFGSPSFFDVRLLPLAPLSGFCIAPFLTLWSRSALAGVILSLSIPGTCMTLAMIAHWAVPALGIPALTAGLLLLLCAYTGALGYRRFRRYEARDAESLGVGIPGWLLPGTASRSRSPLGALLSKELRLQHATFVLAIVVWVLFFVGGLLSQGGKGNWRTIPQIGRAHV